MRFCRYLIVLVLLAMPMVVRAQREKLSPEDLEFVQKTWPNAKRTSTGLRYVVLAEGQGELAKPGDLVRVLYTGWLLDGTIFDKSLDPQKPLEFRLGRHNVIEGWDQGLQLMRPGEKRLFIIPYELAYGSRGQPPSIPPRATLVFEVNLLEVKK
jgi:FKBP-type peptidyl-prolyl cis-trans isomerase